MEDSIQEDKMEMKKEASFEDANGDDDEDAAKQAKAAAPVYPPPRERMRIFFPLMGFCVCFYIGVVGWSSLLPQYIMARLRAQDPNATFVAADRCNISE